MSAIADIRGIVGPMSTTKIGPFIAQMRNRMDITQSELADLRGVSRSAQASLEDPSANPTWSTVQSVFAALGLASWLAVVGDDGFENPLDLTQSATTFWELLFKDPERAKSRICYPVVDDDNDFSVLRDAIDCLIQSRLLSQDGLRGWWGDTLPRHRMPNGSQTVEDLHHDGTGLPNGDVTEDQRADIAQILDDLDDLVVQVRRINAIRWDATDRTSNSVTDPTTGQTIVMGWGIRNNVLGVKKNDPSVTVYSLDFSARLLKNQAQLERLVPQLRDKIGADLARPAREALIVLH